MLRGKCATSLYSNQKLLTSSLKTGKVRNGHTPDHGYQSAKLFTEHRGSEGFPSLCQLSDTVPSCQSCFTTRKGKETKAHSAFLSWNCCCQLVTFSKCFPNSPSLIPGFRVLFPTMETNLLKIQDPFSSLRTTVNDNNCCFT